MKAKIRPETRERADYAVLPFLGGVELLTASFTTHAFSRHFHEGYAIGRILRGAMRFHYLGENLVAPAGEVNLVVPGETHDGQAADASGWAYRMFYLKPEALYEASKALSEKPFHPDFSMGVIRDPALAARVAAAHAAMENPDVSLMEKETRLLRLLADWISRHADQRRPWPEVRPDHGPARLARDYIEAHCGRDIPLSELSRAANASPFHLVRLFTREYGLPPHAFLTQTRLDRAKELLTGRGPVRLADVAAAAGFADQSHLTRLFKRRFGFTPGKFRKIVQNT